jgi:hypothetical protein
MNFTTNFTLSPDARSLNFCFGGVDACTYCSSQWWMACESRLLRKVLPGLPRIYTKGGLGLSTLWTGWAHHSLQPLQKKGSLR